MVDATTPLSTTRNNRLRYWQRTVFKMLRTQQHDLLTTTGVYFPPPCIWHAAFERILKLSLCAFLALTLPTAFSIGTLPQVLLTFSFVQLWLVGRKTHWLKSCNVTTQTQRKACLRGYTQTLKCLSPELPALTLFATSPPHCETHFLNLEINT